MTDIQKFENWTEVSQGYYRYVVAANACYELIALRRGAKTGPDYYNLYVTGEWKDQSGTPVFKRECLKSCETLANCLYAASEDFEANSCDECHSECEVTENDIRVIKNLITKNQQQLEFNEMQALAKVTLSIYEMMKGD